MRDWHLWRSWAGSAARHAHWTATGHQRNDPGSHRPKEGSHGLRGLWNAVPACVNRRHRPSDLLDHSAFALIGTKPLLRQLIAEVRRNNETPERTFTRCKQTATL